MQGVHDLEMLRNCTQVQDASCGGPGVIHLKALRVCDLGTSDRGFRSACPPFSLCLRAAQDVHV
jgi:hypothetical protein